MQRGEGVGKMSTIDSKEIIDDIIKNDGYYYDDPRVYMIVEYMNAWGNITWGVTWSNEHPQNRLRYLNESKYIRNPKILWRTE